MEFDAGSMHAGDSIKVKDLDIAKDQEVELITDPEATVAVVSELKNAAAEEQEEGTRTVNIPDKGDREQDRRDAVPCLLLFGGSDAIFLFWILSQVSGSGFAQARISWRLGRAREERTSPRSKRASSPLLVQKRFA